MKTLAIIQARMGSRRFPGKSLVPLHGRPVIAHAIDRARGAQRVDEVVVATTTSHLDDELAAWCAEVGVLCYRGDVDDVLKRFSDCARAYPAHWIVRLTADNPFLPSHLIDDVIEWCHRDPTLDYSTSNEPPTLPEGLSAECVPTRILHWMAAEVSSPFEREHVTLHVRLRSDRFRQAHIVADPDLSHIRLTVDYPEDLDGLNDFAEYLDQQGWIDNPTLDHLVAAWNACPEVQQRMSLHQRDLWRRQVAMRKRTA